MRKDYTLLAARSKTGEDLEDREGLLLYNSGVPTLNSSFLITSTNYINIDDIRNGEDDTLIAPSAPSAPSEPSEPVIYTTPSNSRIITRFSN